MKMRGEWYWYWKKRILSPNRHQPRNYHLQLKQLFNFVDHHLIQNFVPKLIALSKIIITLWGWDSKEASIHRVKPHLVLRQHFLAVEGGVANAAGEPFPMFLQVTAHVQFLAKHFRAKGARVN